ncbi:hypothetical protein [Paludisphaera borealis]|uniref:hypothetical protein n=1 Tax=Paludisphaera borealis TaxID=1387353 RepID=UPI00143DC647|nr:hypothetical protein [Paludisphaera borealis]MDR3619236.1 hypothetical protein [Paludisphaera borealis]
MGTFAVWAQVRVAATGHGPSAADDYDTLGELEVRLGRVSSTVRSPIASPIASSD